jgi:hypothetical protein
MSESPKRLGPKPQYNHYSVGSVPLGSAWPARTFAEVLDDLGPLDPLSPKPVREAPPPKMQDKFDADKWLGKNGLSQMLARAGAKKLSPASLSFIEMLAGKKADPVYGFEGALLGKELAVVRRGDNPATIAALINGEWLEIGRLPGFDPALLAMRKHFARTGPSPKHREVIRKRAEAWAEREAEIAAEAERRARQEEIARTEEKASRWFEQRNGRLPMNPLELGEAVTAMLAERGEAA